QAELDRWSDEAYVAARARERLSFVMPGETAYRVIDPETVTEPPAVEDEGPLAGPALPAGSALQPWYTTVWESVRIAGEVPVDADADVDAHPGDDGAGGDVAGEPAPRAAARPPCVRATWRRAASSSGVSHAAASAWRPGACAGARWWSEPCHGCRTGPRSRRRTT